MKLKNQEVSVGLAKEMKELGVKQDSQRYWVYYTRTSLAERDWKELCGTEDNMEEFELELDYNLCKRVEYIDRISAYTVAELGEMLPEGFFSQKDRGSWGCANPNNTFGISNINDCGTLYSEADARAKMVIYLIKEGFIKAEEIGR